jgi:hypothetical protein
MDQLIIFMALAVGQSRVLCNGLTSISSLHLETAIHFTTLLTGARFKVVEMEGALPTTSAPLGVGGGEGSGTGVESKRPRLVICDGVGWMNQ